MHQTGGAAKYGNIGIFGELVDRGMCAAEEHTWVIAAHKASIPKSWWVLPSMETLVSLEVLWADGCVKLKNIRGLAKSSKLQSLIVAR